MLHLHASPKADLDGECVQGQPYLAGPLNCRASTKSEADMGASGDLSPDRAQQRVFACVIAAESAR